MPLRQAEEYCWRREIRPGAAEAERVCCRRTYGRADQSAGPPDVGESPCARNGSDDAELKHARGVGGSEAPLAAWSVCHEGRVQRSADRKPSQGYWAEREILNRLAESCQGLRTCGFNSESSRVKTSFARRRS